MKRYFLSLFLLLLSGTASADGIRISTFFADVTPPVGSPLCFSNIKPAETIEEPLTARGVVIFSEEKPVVLCVADFVVVANASHDAWREALAEAAGTTPDRVAMHVIHNHDSPGYDLSAAIKLDEQGLPDLMALRAAHDKAISDTAVAIREAVKTKTVVTHLGLGSGIVEKFASNRRIIGEDGKLLMFRMSSSRNEEVKAKPEGTIDPELSLIAFWNEDTPLAALTFYASHPQSYYGRGGVTPDTVGLARNRRTKETGALHIHFDGAGGNIAAGKYNDGSPEARVELTDRVHEGMATAWEKQEKIEMKSRDFAWKVLPTEFPWSGRYTEEQLQAELTDPKTSTKDRIRAARDVVYLHRWREGGKIDLNCLRFGSARVLFFPGELFVEYQLAAKAMRSEDFVAVAAYGDGGPGYIGTAVAYDQGGYEVGRVSRTGAEIEAILTKVTRQLLDAK